MRATGHYYVSSVFRAQDAPDHMPWYKVEDVFAGNKLMLTMLVEQIIDKRQDQTKWQRVACYLFQKYQLGSSQYPSEYTKSFVPKLAIAKDDYKDLLPVDNFGPVSSDECLRIPDSCQVVFIQDEEGVS